MIAFLACLALAQAKPPQLGPIRPAGVSSEFQNVCLTIEDKLQKGDFVGAKAALQFLPKKKISVAWDDSKVPKEFKGLYVEFRNKALKELREGLDVSLDVASPGDIQFTFVESLPKVEGEAWPPGAVHLFGDDPSKPRLEVVIALRRAPTLNIPGQAADLTALARTDASDIHNEVAFGVMTYLGLAETKLSGSFSSRSEHTTPAPTRLAVTEVRLVNQIFEISDKLRKAVAEKRKLIPAKPKISLQPAFLDLPVAKQGDTVRFSIQVNNQGNSPLNIRVQPDCGCLTATFDPDIPASRSAIIQASVNTIDFVGKLKKRFFIYSNDPDTPLLDFVVNIKIVPVFRFLMPEGSTILLDEGPKTVYAYLVVADGVDMTPTEVHVDGGLQAKVSFEPWSGTLADPELGEGEEPRKGFRFKIELDDKLATGRSAGTIVVSTGNPNFPAMRRNVYVQKGILALPEMVYFGHVPKQPRRVNILLSRPERNFKVLKVETDLPFFTAACVAVRDEWEYRITVSFDGKADFGSLDGFLTITTDDPKQPTIRVPIKAIVQ